MENTSLRTTNQEKIEDLKNGVIINFEPKHFKKLIIQLVPGKLYFFRLGF